jgi:hypothetical protein
LRLLLDQSGSLFSEEFAEEAHSEEWLDFFDWNWELIVASGMTGIAYCNQEEWMVLPGIKPFTG